MNKIFLIGRLCKDPDIRYSQTANGNMAIARYSLAVPRKYKQQGEPDCDFINCVAFGKNGEFAEKYLYKGIKIAVEGRIQTGSYTNKDGVKVYTTDIIVESTEFCESKNAAGGNNQSNQNSSGFAGQQSFSAGDGDFMQIPDGIDAELPFD